jgi:GMP synthase (glutamine-hydrolysing)
MSRVLLVQVGSTVPRLVPRRGDFDDWFRAGLAPREVDVVRPHLGDSLPDRGGMSEYGGVVVTGSSAMVTDEELWSVATEAWLADLARRGTCVLGVCYGHQLLARGLGGEAGWSPNGREIGTIEVYLTAEASRDPLFEGLPSPLVTQATHKQSVLALPPGARRLAYNVHDPNQAFAFGERTWGVQFHPEFDADIVRDYVAARREDLTAEGLDAEALLLAAREGEHAGEILRRFAALV